VGKRERPKETNTDNPENVSREKNTLAGIGEAVFRQKRGEIHKKKREKFQEVKNHFKMLGTMKRRGTKGTRKIERGGDERRNGEIGAEILRREKSN